MFHGTVATGCEALFAAVMHEEAYWRSRRYEFIAELWEAKVMSTEQITAFMAQWGDD